LIRAWAALGLARTKEPTILPTLVRAAGHPNADVRKLAVEAFRYIEVCKALPHLEERIGDDNHSVKSTAIDSLGFFPDEEATKAILDFVENDPTLASHAISALRHQATTSAAHALTEFLKHKNSAVQRAATSALELIGDPEVKYNAEAPKPN
jgi:HEAT repeat protein